jgi:DNA-binding beta-propeller fold protein YncE
MRRSVRGFLQAVLLLTAGGPALAAATAEQVAEGKELRALIGATPVLAMERIVLTPTVKLVGISAIAPDAKGNIYVIHRPTDGSDPIVALDSNGKVLATWGKGLFTMPHGIRIDPAGNVWTTDSVASTVQKFTPRGEKLLHIDVGDVPKRSGQGPCGVADVAFSPAGDGHVFVADGYCNSRVVEYDGQGKKVREWGKPGSKPGEFQVLHAIGIGPDKAIYIADRKNGRIQRFELTGKYLSEIELGGEIASIALAPNGDIYAATHPEDVPLDLDNNVVKIDHATSKVVGKIETRSHELAVGADGTVYPATRDDTLVIYRPRP